MDGNTHEVLPIEMETESNTAKLYCLMDLLNVQEGEIPLIQSKSDREAIVKKVLEIVNRL